MIIKNFFDNELAVYPTIKIGRKTEDYCYNWLFASKKRQYVFIYSSLHIDENNDEKIAHNSVNIFAFKEY